MRVFALLVLFGCGARAPDDCPEPQHIKTTEFQCVSNGCGLSDLHWSALDCEPVGPWQTFPDCSTRATFRCANERTADVLYADGRAVFAIHGLDCSSSYVLSGDTVSCADH